MDLWEHIKNNTPYRLYANGSPEGPVSNRSNGIAGTILRVGSTCQHFCSQIIMIIIRIRFYINNLHIIAN